MSDGAGQGDADARLDRARAARQRLADGGIHLAGIRHHSPRCARAVGRLIEEVRPAVVLIEGPDDLDPLLPALAHPDTVPPVALLTLRGEGAGAVSALYPLASFSPEWVAVRTASALGVPVHLVDLPWSGRAGEADEVEPGPGGEGGADEGRPDDVALLRRTLQSERYFAHSRTLAELARRFGCRDHDELWEHLFEIARDPGGEAAPGSHAVVLDDVFVWAALSRLDYEVEVLAAEGSLAREHRMLEHVERWRGQVDGPIVVVTGAFHTLALVEALADLPGGELVRTARTGTARPRAAGTEPGWLIRYTLDQLDGLRGYGAGMPSPGFHQRVWDAADPGVVARDVLLDLAADANASGQLDRIGTASLTQAVLQAERLADLREHAWPGRTDVLDAVVSCLTQGEVPPALRESLGRVLGGTRLGELPSDLPQPPLVAAARRRAEQLRFVVADAQPRTTSLDVYRQPGARSRSRYLALMTLLGTGFARLLSGPRYASGTDVHLLRETWEYAWTPGVETRLVGLIELGSTPEEAATALLARRADALTAADSPPSPRELAALVTDAAQAGLAALVPPLLARVREAMETTADLGALADAGAVLLRAWSAREHLDLGDSAGALLGVIDEALLGSGHRLALLGSCAPEEEAAAIGAVVGVRRLVLERGRADGSTRAAEAVLPTLTRMRDDVDTAAGVRGALLALAVTDGELPDAELASAVGTALAPGADPGVGVRLLEGVMTVAPELVVRDRGLLGVLDRRLGSLEDEQFLTLLPDLRRSFARLRPIDTDRLARHVAEATGVRVEELAARLETSEADLALGTAVDAEVRASLVDDALLAWAGGEGRG
ncbi:hypothetical protein C8046_14140 [Serinibacter arcticus]|uniref:Uncharacterized protein n=1 Tax=Serinibacter arcticus TaxID=1655435 RepID=A0A2U1ZXA1_9MICO|nr:DUF5682 family protein [Serinibacter arcticus]PWD51616.1 hypothetical protein C8046_14140 [Serinibacter arcticus]